MTATSSDGPTLVTLRGGLTADCRVVKKLLDIEARGCRFEVLPDGRIRVSPSGHLTADEIAVLRLHRDEVRRLIEVDAQSTPY